MKSQQSGFAASEARGKVPLGLKKRFFRPKMAVLGVKSGQNRRFDVTNQTTGKKYNSLILCEL
jgi:hypothetical protein